jgi:hypothetical protein
MQKSVANPMTVLEYCKGMERKDIIINRKYQRNDSIWPDTAKSFLIETILLGYEIPKFYLYPITDVKTRKAVKEVVDGQQRSSTIYDFYTGKLRLSSKLDTKDAADRTYEELDEELQKSFLDYSLSIDLFLSASQEDIREVFRRMNSYNVPANPEEQRHARFQGRFKWFIAGMSKDLGKIFTDAGIFNEKSLVRMADCKLLTDISHALKNGISTTNKSSLNQIYKTYDDHFAEEKMWRSYIDDAFSQILEWVELQDGPLMKHYNVYSLVLAILHVRHKFPSLEYLVDGPKKKVFSDKARVRLLALVDAINNELDTGPDADFVLACSEKTNVKAQREIRFKTFCEALVL